MPRGRPRGRGRGNRRNFSDNNDEDPHFYSERTRHTPARNEDFFELNTEDFPTFDAEKPMKEEQKIEEPKLYVPPPSTSSLFPKGF